MQWQLFFKSVVRQYHHRFIHGFNGMIKAAVECDDLVLPDVDIAIWSGNPDLPFHYLDRYNAINYVVLQHSFFVEIILQQ